VRYNQCKLVVLLIIHINLGAELRKITNIFKLFPNIDEVTNGNDRRIYLVEIFATKEKKLLVGLLKPQSCGCLKSEI